MVVITNIRILIRKLWYKQLMDDKLAPHRNDNDECNDIRRITSKESSDIDKGINLFMGI